MTRRRIAPERHQHVSIRSLTKTVTTMALLVVGLLALNSPALGTTIGQTPWKIDGGKAQFGSGGHFLGIPIGDGLVTWDLTPVNGVLTAKATVAGQLYYNSLGPGTAMLLIEFKSITAPKTLVTVATRTITVSGPGGDANLAANQVAVNESFAARDLFTVVVTTFEVGSSNRSLTNGHSIVDSTDSHWSFSPGLESFFGFRSRVQFGGGTHPSNFGRLTVGGSVAFVRSLPNATLTPATPLGRMLGVVSGTLYWVSETPGAGRILIEFQDANGNTLSGRFHDLFGPGGDPNSSRNQLNISENFISPSLFQIRLRVGELVPHCCPPSFNKDFVGVDDRTFRIRSSATGTFELIPSTAEVAVNERLNYAFSWTVPAPLTWHDLETLRLRIRGSEGVIFSVLFDGASQTFALVDEDTGHVGPAFPAGSKERLHTSHATLHLAESSVVGSGATGPTVTLNLSLDFKRRAKGNTFVVEVAASDDQGNEDTFTAAGSVTVER